MFLIINYFFQFNEKTEFVAEEIKFDNIVLKLNPEKKSDDNEYCEKKNSKPKNCACDCQKCQSCNEGPSQSQDSMESQPSCSKPSNPQPPPSPPLVKPLEFSPEDIIRFKPGNFSQIFFNRFTHKSIKCNEPC